MTVVVAASENPPIDPISTMTQMKALTVKWRILYEEQIRQLRGWCQLLWPDAQGEVQVHLDEDGDPWSPFVEYRLTTQNGKKVKVNRNLTDGLVRSVRWLLGEEWGVRVVKDGETVVDEKGTVCQRKTHLETLIDAKVLPPKAPLKSSKKPRSSKGRSKKKRSKPAKKRSKR